MMLIQLVVAVWLLLAVVASEWAASDV